MLLLVESTLVGDLEPITPPEPFTREISLFIEAVVVNVVPELLSVPIGAVVEAVKRVNDPKVVLGGKPGNNGSLANLRAVVCGVIGRPLPIEPTPFIPPFEVEKDVGSDLASVPQIEGEGGGGLELNPMLWLGMIKSSVGEGMRS